MKRANKHVGSSLDDFLRKEGLFEITEGLAAWQVIALGLEADSDCQVGGKLELAARAAAKRPS